MHGRNRLSRVNLLTIRLRGEKRCAEKGKILQKKFLGEKVRREKGYAVVEENSVIE